MSRAAVLILGLAAAAALLLLTACGGEGGEVSPTATVAGSPTAGATATPEASPVVGPAKDLIDLVAKGEKVTYKATYKATVVANGETREGTFAVYQKPPRTRYDSRFAAAGDRQASEVRLIFTDEETISCHESPSGWACLRTQLAGGPEAMNPLWSQEEIGRYDITGMEERTIIGERVQCFLGKSKPEFTEVPQEAESCLNKDGIALYFRTEGPEEGESTLLEASELSRSVSDDDFEPPAEPQTRR